MIETLRGALRSKTMWFNFVAGVVYVAEAYAGEVSAIAPAVAPLIPGVVVVGNIVLRMMTTTSLSNK